MMLKHLSNEYSELSCLLFICHSNEGYHLNWDVQGTALFRIITRITSTTIKYWKAIIYSDDPENPLGLDNITYMDVHCQCVELGHC